MTDTQIGVIIGGVLGRQPTRWSVCSAAEANTRSEFGYKLGYKRDDAGPATRRRAGVFVLRLVEATTGLEPVYAVLQTAPWPLGHVAMLIALAAPRGFEPRFTDPKSAVLPARRRGIGATLSRLAGHRSRGRRMERKTGLEPATLTLAR